MPRGAGAGARGGPGPGARSRGVGGTGGGGDRGRGRARPVSRSGRCRGRGCRSGGCRGRWCRGGGCRCGGRRCGGRCGGGFGGRRRGAGRGCRCDAARRAQHGDRRRAAEHEHAEEQAEQRGNTPPAQPLVRILRSRSLRRGRRVVAPERLGRCGHLGVDVTGGHGGEQVPRLRGRRPALRVDAQQLREDAGQGPGMPGWVGLSRRDLVQQGVRVVVEPERRCAFHRGVERGAEREDVRRRGRLLDPARPPAPDRRACPAINPCGSAARRPTARETPKSVSFTSPFRGDQYVAGLHVAVHDTREMRGGQPIGHLAADVCDLRDRQRPLPRDPPPATPKAGTP